MSEQSRPRLTTRISRRVALVLAPLLVAAGVLVPSLPAHASVFTVACGDIHGVSGLVNQMDIANRTTGTPIVSLAAGCTYVVDEPAWDYDDYGNKIYYDSAFWPIEDRHSHAHMIVEGNGATITRAASGARYRFFDIDFRGQVTLKNLTLSGGLAPHGSDSYYYNAAEGQGGGAIKNEGRLTLENVTLSANYGGSGENGSSGGSGDGFPGGGGGEGGAIWNSGTLTVTGSTISGNRSGSGGSGGNGLINGGQGGESGDGAGIYNRGTLTVSTSVIADNIPGDQGSGGSAIFGAPPSVRGSGAGIYSYSGSVTVSRSLLKGNLSEGTLGAEGGAIALGGGTLSVYNSTFIGNKAWRGGALHLSNATGTVRNSTFAGNDATGTGDQITGDVAAMDRGATLSFANTLMSGNDAGQVDCNIQVWDPPVSYTSLGGLVSDENTGCGTNTVLADPKLEGLGNWGGPTQSRLPKADSAVLGAGVTAYCGGVDQRGATRPASGCDVGAVERVGLSIVGVISGPAIVPLNTAKAYTTSSSAGGAPLDYSWSVSGVAATLSSTTAATPNITFTGSGVATVNLTVKVSGSSASEAVTVPGFIVKVPPAGNRPPTLAWTGTPASTANEGDTKTYAYSYSDADSDAVTPIAGYPSCGTGGTLVTQSMSGGTGSFQCSFPNGPTTPTVSMRVEDYWSTLTTLTQTVTVAEVSPAITVTGPATANEGTIQTFAYTVVEPGSDSFTPVTSCTGTGATKVSGSDTYIGGGSHNSSGTFQCRFASGPASTTATVSANGGSGSTSVTVSNVAPNVAIGGPTPIDENGAALSTYRYLLNPTDPGDQASLTYVAGSASCGGAGVGTVVSADLTAVVCRFAGGPGTAQVTAQVRDPDGATSSGGGKTVTVNNVAPTVTVSQPTGPVVEGATAYYALTATDPGIDTLTVTTETGCVANSVNTATPGKLTATIACVYSDGPATLSRTVQVSDGAASGSATITNQQVVDSAPSIAASFTTPWVYQHTSATLNLGAITDTGNDTVTSIRVYWGDGGHTDLTWPIAGGQASHLYDTTGWFTPTIDLVDEDGTHTDRGPDLVMPAYDVTATVVLNAPPSALEGVPTTITFSVNEDFTIDYATCYMDFDADNVPFMVPATNVVKTARGGSFECTWPQAGRDADVYLGIVGSGWTLKQVHISNAPPVVTWDDPVPLTVTEDDGTWVRFPFHASDSGSLGLIVRSYPWVGFDHMWGCGDGNPTRGSYVGGPPVFDRNTGTGYLDCLFVDGPQSAVVWLTMSDFLSDGDTSIYRTVTVLNGAPSATMHGPTEPVTEGSTVDFTYDVSDPGSDEVTVETRSCGPGGTVTNSWTGGFSCVYDDGPNTALASITVTDGEVTASDVAAASVIDVVPTGELWGGDFYPPGQDYSLTLANLADPGDDDVETVIVDWGDGSASFVTDGSSTFTRQYQGIGVHTITVSVVNDDGEFVIGTKEVRDADQSFPVWTPHGDQTIERNHPNGAVFSPTLEAADDRGVVSIGCWPGPFFYLVSQPMQCFATDAAGNTSWDYWTLHVVDTVLPVLTPADTHFEATSPDGAIVNFGVHVSDIGLPYPLDQQALVCSPASGTLLPVGGTPVHCSATDDGGNTGTVDFTITVGDTTPPAVAVPADLSVFATDADGAIVDYDAATAYDRYDGTITPDCTPASGSTFPLGTTTVTCTAIDGSANEGHESFTVTVTDRTGPVVTTSPNVLAAPTGPDGAIVVYDAATAIDAVDGAVDPAEVSCDPASGATFALGVTVVTCSAEDAAENPGSASFTVTVQDPDAPTLAPPVEADTSHGLAVVTAEATGALGAVVPWTTPVATDLIDGALAVDCDHDPGDSYPLGRTLVTCTADDSAYNRGTLAFAVDVLDTTPPTIDTVADPVLEATSPDGAVATFAPPAASDLVDGDVSVVCTPASGSVFLIGTTTVNCTAHDAHHNASSRSFTVTVADTTAPELQLSDVTVGAAGPTGATVFYAPVGADLVDGDVPALCTPASGALFASESWTTVSCSVVDVHGNRATGSFTVTVHGAVTTEDLGAEGAEVEVSLDIFSPGDYVIIDDGGADEEVRYVSELGSIVFAAPVAHAHPAGTSVSVIAPPSNDTTPPVISITRPAPVIKGSTLNATVTCTDDGVGVEACRVPALPTLSLGEHVVTVRAWDWNGNLSTAELRYIVVSAASGLAATGVDGASRLATVALLLLVLGVGLVGYRRRRPEWLQN